MCITEFLRLCSEDSDFAFKLEEMCDFFDKRGYPAFVVQAGHHRVQLIDLQSALQTSQKKKLVIESHSPSHSTLTFYSHNHAVKSIILKKFKLLQNDPDTLRVLSQLSLTSFNRDKKIGNFLVRSAFQVINPQLLSARAHYANVSSVSSRASSLRSLLRMLA